MTTAANINRPAFVIISTITICISGLLTFVNLSEFFLIAILKQTDGYPFGGEGPVPYYYKTAEIYSTVNLVWGLLFLTTLLIAIRTAIKGERKKSLLLLAVTLLLLLTHIIQGYIGG